MFITRGLRWFGLYMAIIAGPVVAQSGNVQDWQGAYGGIHLGGAYADFENRVPALPGPLQDAGSVIGGFQLGYNWQDGSTVYGAEADVSLMDIRGGSAGGSFEENVMTSLRFRAGRVVGDTLFYGTLGVALTEKRTALAGLGSTTDYEPGFILGGGAEKWLKDGLTGRVEAIYVDVPKTRQTVGGVPTSGGSQNLIFRAGLNLHF